MNSYDELFSLKGPQERRKDLSGILAAAKKLGHPERKFPTVHVGGTNGKGTVCFKLAEVLKDNGYRVGLFTSPHLFTYRERIQINGKMIPEEEVFGRLSKILPLAEEPTFFDVTTLLAFDYFADEEIDVAVIEVGIGGRLDATNIVTPILSIITSIGYDHMAILGETLEEIATEKGGIIREGIPVIVGETAALPPILEKATDLTIARNNSTDIVRRALKKLPFSIDVGEGIRRRPPCRYEKRGDVIFDVAHNPTAFERLFKTVQREYPGKKIHLLLGLSKDKDVEDCLEVIERYTDHIALLPVEHPRLLPHEAFRIGTPLTAEKALTHAKQENAVAVVTGSFYIMSSLKPLRESLGLLP
ncbi:bifunctional folylpolyglutamate synthase/dihydrofolate synthase [Candidatus Neptunochlamydia vexilliferae]|uniref:Dihydrofolate synthase/folylpolyglutamate synthase n=1 Tax=Candidatus Neptunichlamydia vexilliferae TaxID=1651774 RepID=A0ABS0AYW6_9BACT|nr:Mur ligase family protein [Candidatus Neptunochlamydia vexilliferae]MBF5058671.1 hypothetical protein [Candidatus Neptunochlamydia vexilliferae]